MRTKLLTFLMLFFALLGAKKLDAQTTYRIGYGSTADPQILEVEDFDFYGLLPGDSVIIEYREEAYKGKIIIDGCIGTEEQPIVICGELGPNGERPIIDGNNASTKAGITDGAQSRGIIRIMGYGGADNGASAYITISNLEIMGAAGPNTYTSGSGSTVAYTDVSAGIYVESADNVTISNNVIHGCSQGIWIVGDGYGASPNDNVAEDLLIEKNYIYDCGVGDKTTRHEIMNEGSINVTYQYNRFGLVRNVKLDGTVAHPKGSCIDDHSANTVVRYNWFEGGRYLLDLLEPDDNQAIVDAPNFNTAQVYGNTFVSTEAAWGNNMMALGGWTGVSPHRTGPFYIYNNTFVNERADGAYIFQCDMGGITVDARNNVMHSTVVAPINLETQWLGAGYGFTDANIIVLKNNWIDETYMKSEDGSLDAEVTVDESNVLGTDPVFVDAVAQDYHLAEGSACINAGTTLGGGVEVTQEYIKHQLFTERFVDNTLDIGAFEFIAPVVCEYAIAPLDASAIELESTGNVTVTAGETCDWTAVSNDSWITVTSGASGTGNGEVAYSVAVNLGEARTGTITIADKTFTINQDASTVSVKGIIDSRISIYPNPTSEKLTIELSKAVSQPVSYKIFNSLGNVVAEEVLEPGTLTKVINVKGLAQGMYYIQVNGMVKKIMINK